MMTRLLILLAVALLASSTYAASGKALIYKGPGSCVEDCSEASFQMAALAGLDPVYVSPDETNPLIFTDAKVWIQPGGVSETAYYAMAPELIRHLKEFVKSGGAYVGFCAGGFMADLPDGGYSGLGFIPGFAYGMRNLPGSPVITQVTWKNQSSRKIYWEGGPYFKLKANSGFEIISRYHDGKIAGVQGPHGQGRVSVVGYHPEAPQWWREDFPADDTDGLDFEMAVEMIRWAARL